MRKHIALLAFAALNTVTLVFAQPNHDSPIPPGGIILWSGSLEDVPEGWVLCDGRRGTPDLTDRFVLGAGFAYEPHETGGSASHSHGAQIGWAAGWDAFNSHVLAANNDSSEEHIPPFHALAYIMRRHPFSLDARANGVSRRLRINAGDPLSVVMSLHPGNLWDQDADWWILRYSSKNRLWQYFDPLEEKWRDGIKPSYQRPLQSFTHEVVRIEAAATGRSVFLFGIDLDMDGKLQRRAMLSGFVRVIVRP